MDDIKIPNAFTSAAATSNMPNILNTLNPDIRSNVLITHQCTNAMRDFYKFVSSSTASTSASAETMDAHHIMVYKDDAPYTLYKIEIDQTSKTLYIKSPNTTTKTYFVYDLSSQTYRIKGISGHYMYSFVFVQDEMESNRQVLEIVHSIYINRYMEAKPARIDMLIKKFKYLTKDGSVFQDLTISE